MSTLNTTNLKNPSSGSNNIVLGTDGSTTITTLSATTLSATTITGASVRGGITSGTAVASTSGVAIDFTGIPSWVKRVTVMFSGVSTSGTSAFLIQLGTSSGFTTTGYTASGANNSTSSIGVSGSTAGFILMSALLAANTHSGGVVISSLSSTAWTSSGVLVRSSNDGTFTSGGTVTLSGTLDRIRITTVNGTDTFDAGSVNILWEG